MAAVVAVTALILGACGSSDGATADTTGGTTATGDTTGDTTGELPGGDEGNVGLPDRGTPVVQLRVQGSYPVVQPFLQNGWTTIYADGTVLLPSRASAVAQPQVWPYEVGHLDTVDVAALLMHADAYGLLDQSDGVSYAPPGVADAPKTTLVLSSALGSVTHEAIGLGLGGDPIDDYRDVLMKMVGEIDELVNQAAAKPDDDSTWPVFYDPSALDVVAVDVTETDTGMGTNIVLDWGGDADLSTWTSCTTVDDRATVSFLVGELAGPKFNQGDRLYRIASRVHPPGTTCD
jgi:hypothetical protein